MTVAGRGDDGQATVELALVLPLVALFALFVAQVGLVVREQVLLTHATREAVRAASVAEGDRTAAARRAAEHAGSLDADRLSVESTVDGDRVRVVAHYRSITDLPLIGAVVPDLDLDASATMRAESPVEHGP